MIEIIISLLVYILFGVFFFGFFKKAGQEPWKAFVPFYREWTMLEIIEKPKWWLIMLFIPGIGIFYGVGVYIELVKCFKKYKFWEHALTVLVPFFYFPYLGHNKNEKFYAPGGLLDGETAPKRSNAREWTDALIFAIAAAHLIRMFGIEAYKIPTSSMEPTLQVGDFMFVSKLHYGARIPNTPLGLPFMHHTIPGTKSRAYSEAIKWKYKRLPGLQKIKRNDIVVFNIPFEHDMQSGYSTQYYSGIKYDSRPVDKREHYIKRAVGIPGDKIEVIDNQLFVNDKPGENPELLQFTYAYSPLKNNLSNQSFNKRGARAYVNYRMNTGNPRAGYLTNGEVGPVIDVPAKNIEKFKQHPFVDNVSMVKHSDAAGFPAKMASESGWTIDNYGPIGVPKKGSTIELTKQNFEVYQEVIDVYEGNDLEIKDNQIFINGDAATSYTFKMNYYWMMGDNRHSSLDSRSWGFVPEDHIVGKPLFVFFSSEKGKGNRGIKWDRVLKKAQDMN